MKTTPSCGGVESRENESGDESRGVWDVIMAKALKLIDLFCGTGGFAQGFVDYSSRFEICYAIDCNAISVMTAKANHPNAHISQDDIREVEPRQVASLLGVNKVDVIVGGPPCQGFSSLRPNRSSTENDARNNLFLNYAKFVRCFRPKVFVLENVVGLVTHEQGATLTSILETFYDLGYTCDWRILNAANYGVPQKRERLILIGSKDKANIRFPKPTHYYKGRVIGHWDKSRIVTSGDALPPALSVMDAIGDLPALLSGESAENYTKRPRTEYQRLRRKNQRKLTLHRASNHSDKMLEVIRYAGASISSIPSNLITSGFSSCYSRLDAYEPATTITVKFQSPASSKCIHPQQDRTITPREAARIQGFDDDYVFGGSLTQIAAQIGNAVPPLLGKAIAGEVLKMLE
jgi:DNA (cytosine-5)-methyltransferase 1